MTRSGVKRYRFPIAFNDSRMKGIVMKGDEADFYTRTSFSL